MNNKPWYYTRIAKIVLGVVAGIIITSSTAFIVSNTHANGAFDDWWKFDPSDWTFPEEELIDEQPYD